MKQTTLKYITLLQHWLCYCVTLLCFHLLYVCASPYIFFCIIGHHIPCQRKSAEYYLVYLGIWLLIFRSAPAQILLIALTNTASSVCHKSKQDTVVAPSVGSNLNVSASVNSGTENPYAFCVCSLLYCKLPAIVLSCVWHIGYCWPICKTKPAGRRKEKRAWQTILASKYIYYDEYVHHLIICLQE